MRIPTEPIQQIQAVITLIVPRYHRYETSGVQSGIRDQGLKWQPLFCPHTRWRAAVPYDRGPHVVVVVVVETPTYNAIIHANQHTQRDSTLLIHNE
ncbi:hypothetical protein AFUB_066890 [Aspergillus fumigatus A1163]|uniref:Uncharacterized protein n=1 Tax=Aspergillus fumigatus (strain CBS 144.89 / FGSC A1163 / CEA10) TaxID=451804 RepID=B0Y6G6_ASPFC|nr:hypothetical protein AFUB_066890 [Aspergillus fumigatus A1163]